MSNCRLFVLPVLVLSVLAAAWRPVTAQEAAQEAAQETTLRVVATTTILADVAQNVGGDLLTVTSLLPADVDAHAYEPTTADVARVAQSDLLLTVGAGYETFLQRLLQNAGSTITVVDVSRGLAILPLGLVGHTHDHEADEHADEATAEAESPYLGILGEGLDCAGSLADAETMQTEDVHAHGACDPHVWMNPQNVVGWVDNVVAAFSEADPANADAYGTNGDAYIAQLEALDADIQEMVAGVPQDRRILVTNHEFMGYFAEHYGFEVVATVLPGTNTGGEIDPRSLAGLIALVRDEHVPAIFAEISANPRLADVIASESGVTVVTSLYSEALGGADSPASTYLDFMHYNAQTIVDALASAP